MTTVWIIIVCVAWLCVWVGSRRNLIASGGTCIVCSLAAGVAAGLACDALGIPRHPWQALFLAIIPLPVLGGLMAYASMGERVTVAGVVAALADAWTEQRRRMALRADVRRRVKSFKVEVA